MGRTAMFDREEQRKNQVVVPLSEREKKQIKEAAAKIDRSMASFVRMVLNEHFAKEAN
jgi:hypothetical protein